MKNTILILLAIVFLSACNHKNEKGEEVSFWDCECDSLSEDSVASAAIPETAPIITPVQPVVLPVSQDQIKKDMISRMYDTVEVTEASIDEISNRLTKSRNVANRPLKLAKYLETSALILKNSDTRYRWNEQGSCNIGIMAQLVTGLTPLEIEEYIKNYPLPSKKYGESWTWSGAVSQYCSITGQSKIEIINKITAVGMEREDFYHLEYLNDKEIIKRADIGTDKFDYRNDEHLIKYLEAWAAMIREYNKLHPEPTQKPVKKAKKKEQFIKTDSPPLSTWKY